jgi:hypothetical protein
LIDTELFLPADMTVQVALESAETEHTGKLVMRPARVVRHDASGYGVEFKAVL